MAANRNKSPERQSWPAGIPLAETGILVKCPVVLTKRQQEILRYVQTHQREHGVIPSQREIQAHFGFASVNAVDCHLAALEKKGALVRRPGIARGLVLPHAHPVLDIPIFGTIPAGPPSANEQMADGHLAIDPTLFKLRPREEVYSLRVRGDSMEGAGIQDGDFVVMACRPPRHRDIVGALVDGEATLKRLVINRGKPVLMPENPNYRPIVATEELRIQGVYVGHVRVHR
jgi:repressor LexA